MTWEIQSIPLRYMDGSARDIQNLLRDGWEPYAVTQGGPRAPMQYHFRRQVEDR